MVQPIGRTVAGQMGRAMKSILSFVMPACLMAMSCAAAPLCASPSELKLLKAAVLEQALTSAALSCHLDAEFGRFVTVYHQGMADSDRALKTFFARRPSGESYEAYKARIADGLVVRSLHDEKFCAEAARVFEIALQHKQAAPPKLIATGYEHCGKPVMAAVEPALRPVKPAPVPVPVLSPMARKALALAEHTANPPPIPHPAMRPTAPMKFAVVAPKTAALPAKPVIRQAERIAPAPDVETVEDDTPDPIPNAYKPGAYWVDERRAPPAEINREGPPLVQGPDGRWYVIIGHHAHWNSD